MKKKIAVLTGSRSEYGLLKPILKKILVSQQLELNLIVTGMHLSFEHGHTVDEIEKDGFPIRSSVDMLLVGDSPAVTAKSIGIGMIGMTQTLTEIKPDLLMVLGDRSEALVGALSAAIMQIPVTHIHGGELTRGCIDDSLRHCITKLSHLHFAPTLKSAERILAMGEEPWRVHVVGAPGLDSIIGMSFLSREIIFKRFNLDINKKLILVVYHPETIGEHDHYKEMKIVLEAVKSLNEQAVIVYPNSDAGYSAVIRAINEYKEHAQFYWYPSLSQQDYLNLMKESSLMIGNSSSGIIEAPSFYIPVINIGQRQLERERALNIIDVSYDYEAIVTAMHKAESDRFIRSAKKSVNPYGNGNASIKIINILESIKTYSKFLKKAWHYDAAYEYEK